MGLADARKARDQARILLDNGINPSQNRKQEKIEAQHLSTNTFELVANEYITEILTERSSGYISKFKKALEFDVFPVIGAVMRYAIATLRADNDPTYAVRGAIARPEI